MVALETAPGPIPLVLIAETDAQSRSEYTDSLHAVGCDVIEAADGRDALAKALIRPPSLELRLHSHKVRAQLDNQLRRSARLTERANTIRDKYRHATTTPPLPPPSPVCPSCGRPLVYMQSYAGGVSVRQPEQWDYFKCSGGCGAFQ